LINAATGFDYATVREFELVGERINTLARVFNAREGLVRQQDTLPARNLTQPLQGSGPAKGQVVELDPMLDEYYTQMDWDQNGVPISDCLRKLGLSELFQDRSQIP
jgi:aldehyde:ferredoxin oxidoreductase